MSNSENPARVLIETNKCFKIILSTKTEVKCDKDEIKRVIAGIKDGGIIKLKQGLINPSFIVAVVEDEERRLKFVEQINDIENHNRQDNEYHGGRNQRQLPSGMKPLKNILAGIELRLPEPDDVKRLGKGQ